MAKVHSTPVPYDPSPVYPDFEGATFVAYLDTGSMNFGKGGQLSLKFNIPAEHVEQALALQPLLRKAIPVEVDVALWRPFAERVMTDEVRIAVMEQEMATTEELEDG